MYYYSWGHWVRGTTMQRYKSWTRFTTTSLLTEWELSRKDRYTYDTIMNAFDDLRAIGSQKFIMQFYPSISDLIEHDGHTYVHTHRIWQEFT